MINKWYKLYYQDSKSVEKLKPNSTLIFKLNKNARPKTQKYKDSLKSNARMIADCVSGTLDVLLSGGIDSEVVVRINHDLGIKQNVIIVRYEDNINIRDVNSAIEICQSLSIKPHIVDFNLKDFFENEAEDFYYKTYAPRVELLPRFKWHHMFDNTVIFADGEPYWRRDNESNYSKSSSWRPVFYEHEFAHIIYGERYKTNVIGSWYQFTPDIFFTFPKEDIIVPVITDKVTGKVSTWSSRVPLHRQYWPQIKDKSKLVGYEGPTDPPESIPYFMKEFREKVMDNINGGTVIKLSSNDITKYFV